MRKLYIDFLNEYKNSTNFAVGNYDRERCVNVSAIRPSIDMLYLYEGAIEAICETLPKELMQMLDSNKQFLYSTVFEPLYKWISAIDEAIQRFNPDEVVIGFVNFSNIIFTYEAEGEVNNKIFYKNNDYLPNLIFSYLLENHYDIKITFNKKSKFPIFFRFFLRNFAYLAHSLISNVKKYLVYKTFKSNGFSDQACDSKVGINNILIVRNKIQSEFAIAINELLGKKCLVVSYEQISSRSKNSRFLKSKGVDFVDLFHFASLKYILRLHFKAIKHLGAMFFRNNYVLNILGIRISLSSIFAELSVRQIDFEILASCAEKLIPCKVITFDMYTPHAKYLARRLGESNVLQIQTTLLVGKPESEFVAGKRFLFTSEKAFSDMVVANPRQASLFGYIPNPKEFVDYKNVEYKEVKSIIYFTQPVEEENELDIISKLTEICESFSITLSIKVHPRQDRLLYRGISTVKVILDEVKFNDYQMAITRSSSIAHDCWIQGLPIVFVRQTSYMRSITAGFVPDNYLGDIKNVTEVRDLIENYDQFSSHFDALRKEVLGSKDMKKLKSEIEDGFLNAL